ncbi:1,6-anhydro-N-acetylmuramyl-L-alanine amidase AmpD [Paucibacter sp. APW11]|uniref:1,6-anhydro-N-acetylmuramyl-L-alanine amidase AmpD n=1 Tax=Roseateles aquae TaxID=3077235 RepID=A0ABU3PGC3_9BURK|nr:1,6-anhydro-N-acetylmuramyl-L-alanine amidase AmpD [Paucibacter sp. APW11]MDT9001153.1 1,6-anhydro-N-acetylmuramyl-L-alanine amidase AmpD [Paucibacter sp. APW11]
MGAWSGGWLDGALHRASPNVDERPVGEQISLIVLHSISLPPGMFGGDEIERLFTNTLDCDAHPYFDQLRSLRVSAHFLIRRDGALLQFVDCERRARHAGVSRFGEREACNDFSIGIELEGLEGGLFEAAQYAALAMLLPRLAARYPVAAVAGHEHIAPGRKRDPGPGFDWLRLQALLGWPRERFPFLPG